jgi:hypothetical protein
MTTVAPTIEALNHAPQGSSISLPDVVAGVQRLNPPGQPGSATFDAAVLLQAALHVGQNVDRLSRFTGIRREVVARCARRLVDNGVWCAGNTLSPWVGSVEELHSFWADVAVAEGRLCRRALEDGSLEWAPQGYWHKHYEYVAPKGVSLETVCYHAHVEPISQDLPYIVEEDQHEAPETLEVPPTGGDWLVQVPDESMPEPVWLGQNDDAGVPEEPVTVGSGAVEMFPEAVWLG